MLDTMVLISHTMSPARGRIHHLMWLLDLLVLVRVEDPGEGAVGSSSNGSVSASLCVGSVSASLCDAESGAELLALSEKLEVDQFSHSGPQPWSLSIPESPSLANNFFVFLGSTLSRASLDERSRSCGVLAGRMLGAGSRGPGCLVSYLSN